LHAISFTLNTITQNHNASTIYKRSDRIFGMPEMQSRGIFRH
jgi:hypothetical protein